jgi:predicted AAA+ superfamily ATPase
MIDRTLMPRLVETLADSPAVALLGPRQTGKTTLALEVGEALGALYLDLESEADRAKLAQPELYLAGHSDRLVIVDEVHRAPGLFPVLRGLIDRAACWPVPAAGLSLAGPAETVGRDFGGEDRLPGTGTLRCP